MMRIHLFSGRRLRRAERYARHDDEFDDHCRQEQQKKPQRRLLRSLQFLSPCSSAKQNQMFENHDTRHEQHNKTRNDSFDVNTTTALEQTLNTTAETTMAGWNEDDTASVRLDAESASLDTTNADHRIGIHPFVLPSKLVAKNNSDTAHGSDAELYQTNEPTTTQRQDTDDRVQLLFRTVVVDSTNLDDIASKDTNSPFARSEQDHATGLLSVSCGDDVYTSGEDSVAPDSQSDSPLLTIAPKASFGSYGPMDFVPPPGIRPTLSDGSIGPSMAIERVFRAKPFLVKDFSTTNKNNSCSLPKASGRSSRPAIAEKPRLVSHVSNKIHEEQRVSDARTAESGRVRASNTFVRQFQPTSKIAAAMIRDDEEGRCQVQWSRYLPSTDCSSSPHATADSRHSFRHQVRSVLRVKQVDSGGEQPTTRAMCTRIAEIPLAKTPQQQLDAPVRSSPPNPYMHVATTAPTQYCLSVDDLFVSLQGSRQVARSAHHFSATYSAKAFSVAAPDSCEGTAGTECSTSSSEVGGGGHFSKKPFVDPLVTRRQSAAATFQTTKPSWAKY